jgi:dephospho-CoA kinase
MVIKFVGLTGLPGAGKGEFINSLRGVLESHGIKLLYYSLSDELRDEARRRLMPIERPVLRSIANELRLKYGHGILSTMLCKKILGELEVNPDPSPVVIIVDAIRSPEEVLALRNELGSEFILVAVEAPLDLLIERVSARARFDEREEVVKRKDAARKMILKEAGHEEPLHGHNIAECIKMADWHIDNSQTLESLQQQTIVFATKHLF